MMPGATLCNCKTLLLMGIVNLTCDSFSGGSFTSPESAIAHAEQLLADGADILDIGAESTRPGAVCVPVQEECQRVIPVIKELKKLRPSCVISVDTRKSAVAEAALEAGADILNDVSMLRYDPAMTEAAAKSQVPVILAHSRGTPETMKELCDYQGDVVQGVLSELLTAREKAKAAGIHQIILDPNFGFAKTEEQNWELVRHIDRFCEHGMVLAGVSRKSFIGSLTAESEPEQRLGGAVSCVLYLAEKGVSIVRVHDVRQVCDALKVQQHLGGAQ
jgi:dihydropteroate synthase